MATYRVLKDFYLAKQDRIITDRDTIELEDGELAQSLLEKGNIERAESGQPTEQEVSQTVEQVETTTTQPQPPVAPLPPVL
jgi:hypothetical protein